MYCAMFGMIASVGLSNLQFIDLNSARNLFIIGFALFMGLSLPEYFNAHPIEFSEKWDWAANVLNTLGKTGMAVGAVVAMFLDNTIPGTDEERGLIAWNQVGKKDTPAVSAPEGTES
jgi:nucleobase transporter 1/2